MTKPTQAQIEAAARAIRDVEDKDEKWFEFEAHAKAALTAAAEVGDDEPPDLNSVLLGFTNYVNNERVRSYNEGVDDTIERCAQVTESVNGAEFPVSGDLVQIAAKRIAAAIRALKDKPTTNPNIIYPGKDDTNVFPEEEP